MTVLYEKETEEDIGFDYEEILSRVVAEAVTEEQCPYPCEVSITFTDNERIRILNREFRELDVPTDVLSFPMADYRQPGDFSYLEGSDAKVQYFNPETGEFLLGDIVISIERAKEQAKEYGHSLVREIAFLTAHSMLHLMGYDHTEDEGREMMEQKQEGILERLGITRS